MEAPEIILEKEGGIAVLTLNRPRRYNAMSRKMLRESLPQAFAQVNRDRDIKALILTGAGEAFCSGADVGELEKTLTLEGTELDRLESSRQLMQGLVSAAKAVRQPIIAAINGMCAGGGFSLALLCDLLLASDRARFTMAFVRRGLVPDIAGTYTLPRLVGTVRALEIMMLGEVFDAREAERLGIVNKVVPHEELLPATKLLARRLAQGPAVSLELIKRAVHTGLEKTLTEAVDFEAYAQTVCRATEDAKEGIHSFLEKREPVFKGK